MAPPILCRNAMFGVIIRVTSIVICFCFATLGIATDYDPNDFATEVIYYSAGTGGPKDWIDGKNFDDPNSALGRPTVDTTGDNLNIQLATKVPVVGVYPAFRSFELVTIGDGGQLILRFNQPVEDDQNNPYGIDFIVFGNAAHVCSSYWANGNPNDLVANTDRMIIEPAVVSVSQDGVSWYRYDNGPWADGFAPTLGRVHDPNNPDTSIGDWNLWWGEPTNPTFPLDPSLGPEDFFALKVAEAAAVYGRSAGGTGFDLGESGMEWIQYVRIEGNSDASAEVDAVSDVSCCGDYKHPFVAADLNKDCRIDYEDLKLCSQYWLAGVGEPSEPTKSADIHQDGIVNFLDWAVVADGWMKCTWQCE